MASNYQALEAFVRQYGLPRVIYQDYIEQSYTGPAFTAVASVNGIPYSATHPDQNMAREMAAASALRALEGQFRPSMQGRPLYHYPGVQPAQAHPQHYHATNPPHEHYRMELNNMANARGLLPVTYEHEQQTGLQHKPLWTSTVYVAGIKGGEGSGNSRGAAREQAARQAIQYLMQRGYELARRSR